ncbi:MAG: hypothetical protein ACRD82_05175 [Blastocatellia bacterium]
MKAAGKVRLDSEFARSNEKSVNLSPLGFNFSGFNAKMRSPRFQFYGRDAWRGETWGRIAALCLANIDIKKKILSHEATRRITKSRQDSQDWYQDLQDGLLFNDLGNPEKNPVHPVHPVKNFVSSSWASIFLKAIVCRVGNSAIPQSPGVENAPQMFASCKQSCGAWFSSQPKLNPASKGVQFRLWPASLRRACLRPSAWLR